MELNDDLVPRGVPKPTSFQESFNKPEVPEVSLIFDSKSPFEKNTEKKPNDPQEQPSEKTLDPAPVSESYNVWRYKNAHLLNHVSSRSNSFQPAPLYSSPSKNSEPSRSENGPIHNGNCSENGLISNGSQPENRPKYSSESRPISANGRPESGPIFNGFRPENELAFKTNETEYRRAYNRSENGPCIEVPSESLDPQQTIPFSFSNNKLQNYNARTESRPANFNSCGTYGQVYHNNSDHRKVYPQIQNLNSNCVQSDLSSHGQLTTPGNFISPQERIFSPSNKISTMGEMHPGPSENSSNYHMNYMRFSSVTAPISNCTPANMVHNGYNQNCMASELNRNYQDIHRLGNFTPQNHEAINGCSQVTSNPYQAMNGLAKNTERKVSFKEPERNALQSISPCQCDTCLQKAHTRMRSAPVNNSPRREPHRLASSSSPSERQKTKKISTSDLYQIVLNQTEQLTLLREKVDKLLSERTSVCHHCVCSHSSPQKQTIAIQAGFDKTCEEVDLKSKSVGVMTSFHERSSLSPQSQKRPSTPETRESDKKGCSCNCSRQSPASNKSPSEENRREEGRCSKGSSAGSSPFCEKNDVSLTLNAEDLPPVVEHVPSPEPSVHLEMQDFQSSSDDDSIESVKQMTDNVNGKPNGWTFYNNVIGQVNNILHNSPESAVPSQVNPVDAIRQTTLEQLQKLGIFDDKNSCEKRLVPEPSVCPRFNQQANQYNCRESDLSLHMNQLAMKYLNKDQFANAVGIQQDIAVCNMKGGTNLSFTTLRYLERYHLMPAEFKQDLPPGRECRAEANFNHFHPQFENNSYEMPQPITNKVLGSTALNQQPKLLQSQLK